MTRTTRMALTLAAALFGAAAAPGVAFAGPKEEAQAEATRLSEDMKRFAKRNVWRGVDDAYRELLELEKKGVVVSYGDHYLGAEAARSLGDITETYTRVKRAQATQSTPEATAWVDDLERSFGTVEIAYTSQYEGVRGLKPAQMPFAPDQRGAIERAQALLAQDGKYDGLLPYGSYTFGDQSFELSPGAPVQLKLGPAAVATSRDGEGGGLAYIGPRIDLGAGFTQGGSPAEVTAVTPAAYGAATPRAALGLEVGFTPSFGVLAQVGYHGLLGGAPEGAVSGTRVNMGFGWLAGVFRVADLGVAAGPVFGVAAGQVLGVQCGEGGNVPGCDSVADPEITTLEGSFTAAGGALGVTYGLFDAGPFRGGLGVYGGIQNDSQRMLSWGQIALNIGPDPRRDG